MKLIVALGNVGNEYEGTRHNLGFMIADTLNLEFHLEKKFQAYIAQGKLCDEKYLVIKPTTFMNLSGQSVYLIVNYYGIAIEDILVIQDDLDLPVGSYKLKRNSSAGGHNGIKSIISSLHSDAFLRLKVGIGHDRSTDTIDYVLGTFSKDELQKIRSNFLIYQQLIECFILKGPEQTLQEFSKK